jgi:hypothetical protein
MINSAKPVRAFSILTIAILIFVAFYVYKTIVVDRMGFCYKRLWFVSNEELILNVLDGLMKSGRMTLDASDTTPQAYFAHHPKCCSVNWGGGPFDRGLTHFGSASVAVSYEMKREHMSEEDQKQYGRLYYDFYADETACGEAVGHTGSTEIEPVERRPSTNM